MRASGVVFFDRGTLAGRLYSTSGRTLLSLLGFVSTPGWGTMQLVGLYNPLGTTGATQLIWAISSSTPKANN